MYGRAFCILAFAAVTMNGYKKVRIVFSGRHSPVVKAYKRIITARIYYFDIRICFLYLIAKKFGDRQNNMFLMHVLPAAKRTESAVRDNGANYDDKEAVAIDNNTSEQLSIREKEIIACVAKGMTSKEIADRLCLSVHTVTTHRRNITGKLQIHTPAGLTIYAIVNKLVSLDEIKLQ